MRGARRLVGALAIAACCGCGLVYPFGGFEAAGGASSSSSASSSSAGGAGGAGVGPLGKAVWAFDFGTKGDERVLAVAANASGEVAFTGSFYGHLQLGAIALNGPTDTAEPPAAFVARLDVHGTPLWARVVGALDGPGFPVQIADKGDVFIAGTIPANGSIDVAGTPLMASAVSDGFIAHLNSDGTHDWSGQLGATGTTTVHGLRLNKVQQRVTVTGSFSNTINPAGCAVLTAAVDTEGYVAAFKMDGGCYGTFQVAGDGPQVVEDIAFTATAFVLAVTSGAAIDIPLVMTGPPAQSTLDVFLCAFSNKDATLFGILDVASITNGNDTGFVSLAPFGDQIVLTGSLLPPLYNVPAAGSDTGFHAPVVVFDPGPPAAFAHGRWLHGGASGARATAGGTNIFLGGSFRDTLDYGGDQTFHSLGVNDAMIARFDDKLQPVGALTLGTSDDERIDAIAGVDEGTIVIGGVYSSELTIGDTKLVPHGGYDGFVARFSR